MWKTGGSKANVRVTASVKRPRPQWQAGRRDEERAMLCDHHLHNILALLEVAFDTFIISVILKL